MLAQRRGTTKDNNGCEFTYVYSAVFEVAESAINPKTGKLIKGKHYRQYVEKLYIADHDKSLRANSLQELKNLVGSYA